MSRLSTASAVVAAALLFQAPLVHTASAQSSSGGSSSNGWFVPQQGGGGEPHAAPARRAAHAAAPAPVPVPAPEADQQAGNGAPPVLPMPPIPTVAALPKGAAPPPAVIGVLSVPDVMRNSTAAQEVERVLGARRDKLTADAQKEQASWREMQQQLQQSANAKGASADLQQKERALQERVSRAQRDFRNRNRIIQEAAQVALGQIERTLVQVIRQVSESRNMNLVLHREQIALNVAGFDITQEAVETLNKVLPSVYIPDDAVDPEVLAKSGKFPTTADAQAQAEAQAQPAAAPAPAAPARKK